jgi:hypothetical protein
MLRNVQNGISPEAFEAARGTLGGAVPSHVRVGEGLLPVFFPVMVGVLVWLGLYLRDARLRSLIPLRS